MSSQLEAWYTRFRVAVPFFCALVAVLVIIDLIGRGGDFSVFTHVWVWVILGLYVALWALVVLLRLAIGKPEHVDASVE